MGIFYNPPPPPVASNAGTPPADTPIPAQGTSVPPRRAAAAATAMLVVLASWPADLEPRLYKPNNEGTKIAPLTLTYGQQPPRFSLAARMAQVVGTWPTDLEPRLQKPNNEQAKIAPLTLTYGNQPRPQPFLTTLELDALVRAWPPDVSLPPRGQQQSWMPPLATFVPSGSVLWPVWSANQAPDAPPMQRPPSVVPTFAAVDQPPIQGGLAPTELATILNSWPVGVGPDAPLAPNWIRRTLPFEVFPRISTLIDDFNRANQGPPLSAIWSTQSGVGLVVTSNQATAASGTTLTFERYDGAVYGPDCDFFVTVATVPAGGHTIGLYGRLDGSTNGYVVAVIGGSPDVWVIQRVDAGAGTTLGATFTQDLSAGDKIGLRCQGPTIEAWYQASGGQWTRLAARTDSTYNQRGKVGLAAQATTVRLDDLGGGTMFGDQPVPSGPLALEYLIPTINAWAPDATLPPRPRSFVPSPVIVPYVPSAPTGAIYPAILSSTQELVELLVVPTFTVSPENPDQPPRQFPLSRATTIAIQAWQPDPVTPQQAPKVAAVIIPPSAYVPPRRAFESLYAANALPDPPPVQRLRSVIPTFAAVSQPPVQAGLSTTELVQTVLAWQESWGAQTQADNAAWNIPSVAIIAHTPPPTLIWAAWEPPPPLPVRPIAIATLTLPTGVTPVPSGPLSVSKLTQLVAAWAQTWDAQTASDNAGWNVPAQPQVAHTPPPAHVWTAWEPPAPLPVRPITLAPLALVYGTPPRPIGPVVPATLAVILQGNPALTWSAQAQSPSIVWTIPPGLPAVPRIAPLARSWSAARGFRSYSARRGFRSWD